MKTSAGSRHLWREPAPYFFIFLSVFAEEKYISGGSGMAGGFDVKNGNSALIVQKSDYSKILAEIELDSGDKSYGNKTF